MTASPDRMQDAVASPSPPRGCQPERRLLVLLPFPPRRDATHGGGRATAHLLAELATRHRVALLCLRADAEPPSDDLLRERCELVEEVPRSVPASGADRAWAWRAGLLVELLRGRPLWAVELADRVFARRVEGLVRSWRPEIVQAEYHVMAQYLGPAVRRGIPRVLTEHEPGLLRDDRAWTAQGPAARLARRLDRLAWARFEPRSLRRADAVVVFTERDRQVLAPHVAGRPIARIPLGAPLPPTPLDPLGEQPPALLFVGNYAHGPNLDAALRLAREILPRVRREHPNAQLWLVGDRPPPELRRLAGPSVLVSGRVADVTPYLERAALVVAPLRQGGGMRVKVLEALAAGKAVVASRLAAEGLDLTDGEQLALADDDAAFAAAIGRLLADPTRRAGLGTAARAWAVENLGWERAAAAYGRLYERLLANRRASDA